MFLQTMPRDSDGAMPSGLLGLLMLSSLCSARMSSNPTDHQSAETGEFSPDPNTYQWLGLDSEPSAESSEEILPWHPVARNMRTPPEGPPQGPPQGPPEWPPKGPPEWPPKGPPNWPPMPLSEGPPEGPPNWPPMPPSEGHPWSIVGNESDPSDSIRMFGAMGPTSPDMTPNSMNCDMIFNSPEQIPLSCICSHCKGTIGPKGDHGDRGPPGQPGSPGARGMTGFKGRPGFTGPEGMKGQKGDLGDKGQSGSGGNPGDKGMRGFKGEKGDVGSMGLPGSQGPQGETGTCPASCENVPGAPGPQGPPGSAGARGLPGVQGSVGPKGLMGDKGDLGNPGDPGLNGQKGDQGDQGVCECTDGADGDDGIPGVKGAKGDKGDMGVPGIQGIMGLQGNEGVMGLMGQPGPCSPAIQSAFCASINQSFPVENWPVPFYNIITNRQGHFNPNMGTYTVPVNGTYIFSFHLAVVKRPLKVGLFLNHYPVFKITEVSIPATTSHKIVLHLSMGDQVWLQVKDSQTNGMYTDNESTSSFSGYLLHPDSCEFPIGRNFFPRPVNSQEDFSWDGPPGPTTPPPN